MNKISNQTTLATITGAVFLFASMTVQATPFNITNRGDLVDNSYFEYGLRGYGEGYAIQASIAEFKVGGKSPYVKTEAHIGDHGKGYNSRNRVLTYGALHYDVSLNTYGKDYSKFNTIGQIINIGYLLETFMQLDFGYGVQSTATLKIQTYSGKLVLSEHADTFYRLSDSIWGYTNSGSLLYELAYEDKLRVSLAASSETNLYPGYVHGPLTHAQTTAFADPSFQIVEGQLDYGLSRLDIQNANDLSIRSFKASNPPASVPEPSAIALMGLGLIGLASARRKTKNNKV